MWIKSVLFGMVMGSLLFISCRRGLTNSPKPDPSYSAGNVSGCLEAKFPNLSTFSAKISTDVSFRNEKESFKINLKVVHDSAIYATISKVNFIGAKILITPDSVKIMNKMDRCYIHESISHIKKKFNVDLNYVMLESMLLGQPLGYDKNERYKLLPDSNYYILSSHSEKQIEKAFEKLPRKEEKQYIQKYFVDPSNCTVYKTEITSLADSSFLKITNEKYKEIGAFLFPEKVDIYATTPRDTVTMELNFNNRDINQKERFNYRIPDRYEPCAK